MPISRHFKGAGSKVARAMRKHYGSENWKSVFYGTEKKLGIKNPGEIEKHQDLTEEELLLNAFISLEMLAEKSSDNPDVPDDLTEAIDEALSNLDDALEIYEEYGLDGESFNKSEGEDEDDIEES